MKWLLLALGLLGTVGFVWMQRQSVKVSYVNGLPAYSHLPGKEFLFQKDCYIYADDSTPAAYPLVASHDEVPALPALVSSDAVGTTVQGLRLLATARVGDRIKLVSVRREESREGTELSFEILFVDENERPYPRLDARKILDFAPVSQGAAPQFLPDVVVPRVKG